MRSDVKYAMALLLALTLVPQSSVALFAADKELIDSKVTTSSEQDESSESTSDKNKEDKKEDKSTDDKEKTESEQNNTQDEATEKKFSYTSEDYADGNGRLLGSRPNIEDMPELSNKIFDDIETAVSELNLDNYDSNVVTFNVTDDIKPGFVEIYVKVENDYNLSEFKYYVYKPNKSWTNSESEYEETIKKLEEKKSEEDKNKDKKDDKDNIGKDTDKDAQEKDSKEESADSKSSKSTEQIKKPEKVTMIPLRANVEKLGWKVEWEQKTATEPSKAILTKGNQMIKILVDPNTNYDLVINRDTNKTFIETGKLSRPAELQDEVLYVPSTFIDRLTKEREDRLNNPGLKDNMKDKAKENGDMEKKDKPPVKPEDKEKRQDKKEKPKEEKTEDKDIKFSGNSETE